MAFKVFLGWLLILLTFSVVRNIFIHQRSTEIVMLVYIDGILLCGNDIWAIMEEKRYLEKLFNKKDVGKPCYFLGVEVAYGTSMLICQVKSFNMMILK